MLSLLNIRCPTAKKFNHFTDICKKFQRLQAKLKNANKSARSATLTANICVICIWKFVTKAVFCGIKLAVVILLKEKVGLILRSLLINIVNFLSNKTFLLIILFLFWFDSNKLFFVNRNSILWKLAYLSASLAIFLLDQVTKAWAIRKLRFGGDVEAIPNFLSFTYAENTGVAFSQLQDGGDFGRYALSGLALLAATGVMYYFWRVPRTQDRLLGALALVFAGILGNVTDRLRFGFVIDWIHVHYNDWSYPIFNIADAAICVGAGLLIIDMFFSKNTDPETTDKKE